MGEAEDRVGGGVEGELGAGLVERDDVLELLVADEEGGSRDGLRGTSVGERSARVRGRTYSDQSSMRPGRQTTANSSQPSLWVGNLRALCSSKESGRSCDHRQRSSLRSRSFARVPTHLSHRPLCANQHSLLLQHRMPTVSSFGRKGDGDVVVKVVTDRSREDVSDLWRGLVARMRAGVEEVERDSRGGEVRTGVGSTEGGELDALVSWCAAVSEEGLRLAVDEEGGGFEDRFARERGGGKVGEGGGVGGEVRGTSKELVSEFGESFLDSSWRVLGSIVPARNLSSRRRRRIELRPGRNERLPPHRGRRQRRHRLLAPRYRLLPPRDRFPHISSNLKASPSPLVHNPLLPSNPRATQRLSARMSVHARSSLLERLLDAFPLPAPWLANAFALSITTLPLLLLCRLPRAVLALGPLRGPDNVGTYEDAPQSSRTIVL